MLEKKSIMMTHSNIRDSLICFFTYHYHGTSELQQLLMSRVQKTIHDDTHMLDAIELWKELMDSGDSAEYKFEIWKRLIVYVNHIITNNESSIERLFEFQ